MRIGVEPPVPAGRECAAVSPRRRLRLPEGRVKFGNFLQRNLFFELRGNDCPTAGKADNRASASPALTVLLCLVVKEIECAGRSMYRHMLFEVEVSECRKNSSSPTLDLAICSTLQ